MVWTDCSCECVYSTGIILGMGSTNEKQHYNVMSSLIGWAHTQNDPYSISYINCVLYGINSLTPSLAIQHLETWATLVQVVAWCCQATSHCMNKSQHVISVAFTRGKFYRKYSRYEIIKSFRKLQMENHLTGVGELTLFRLWADCAVGSCYDIIQYSTVTLNQRYFAFSRPYGPLVYKTCITLFWHGDRAS